MMMLPPPPLMSARLLPLRRGGRTVASPSGRPSDGLQFLLFFNILFKPNGKSCYRSHGAPQDKQDTGIWALLQVYCEHLIAGFFF